MAGRLSNWQCRFCEWEIIPSSSRPWMKSARAMCLLDGQVNLLTVDFSDERYKYIDDPDKQIAHLVHSSCWEFFTCYFNNDHLDLNKLFETISNISPVSEHRNQPWGPWHPFTTGFSYMGAPLPSCPRQEVIHECNTVIHANATDPFSSLPAEIMKEIAEWTDMVDYLNLRLASRVMASLFHNQSFWRHRFNIHMERGFLNCLVEEDKRRGYSSKADWHKIYYKTHPARMLRHHSRNSCQRILAKYWFWLRIRWIRDTCVKTRIPYVPLPEEEQKVVTDACWHTVNGQLAAGSRYWIPKQPQECPIMESVILPKAFARIAFWVLQTPTRTSIAGMEFITDGMVPNKGIGYQIPGKKCIIEIESREQLRGFEFSIGPEGIHAIRVFTSRVRCASERISELHSSRWIGSPEEPGKNIQQPETCILVSNKDISAIQAGFDDCKLISLAIGTCLKISAEMSK